MMPWIRNWKYIVVIVVFLFLFAYNAHIHNNNNTTDAQGVMTNPKLELAQKKTDKVYGDARDAYARAHTDQSILPRGEVGFIPYIAYSIVKPMLEVRLDAYMATLGLENTIRQYSDITSNLILHDLKIGDGRVVMCGNKVEAIVEPEQIPGLITVPKPPVARSSERTLVMGQGFVARGVELGLLGMREGGVRNIRVPHHLLINRNAKEPEVETLVKYLDYKVKVVKVYNEYPEGVENLFVMDSIKGIEREAMCGDRVAIQMKVFNESGQTIYDKDKIFEFRLGEKKVPTAIGLATSGLKKGGRRFLVAPAELLALNKNTNNEYRDIGFDDQKASLIEIRLLDVTS